MGVFSSELIKNIREEYLEICTHKALLSEIKDNPDYKEAEKAIKYELAKCKERMGAYMDKAKRSMRLASNVEKLWEDWFLIRYVRGGGEVGTELRCLIPHEVSRLRRDGRNERELTENELKLLVPAMLNPYGESLWKDQVKEELVRLRVMYQVSSLEEEKVEEEVSVPTIDNRVSVHAGARYVQRKLNIHPASLEKAEQYFLQNSSTIRPQVLEGFEKATLLFDDGIGIQYFIDDENFVYIWGVENGRIITYYEEDFGFTKAINRSIVDQQIEEVKNAYSKYKSHESGDAITQGQVQEAISATEDEEATLLAQLESLRAVKAELVASAERSSKELEYNRRVYDTELNKLFRRGKE